MDQVTYRPFNIFLVYKLLFLKFPFVQKKKYLTHINFWIIKFFITLCFFTMYLFSSNLQRREFFIICRGNKNKHFHTGCSPVMCLNRHAKQKVLSKVMNTNSLWLPSLVLDQDLSQRQPSRLRQLLHRVRINLICK